MLKHPELTKGRLRRFARELKPLVYPETVPLEQITVYSAPDRISYNRAIESEYRNAGEKERFGPEWSTHWFRLEYPERWRAKEPTQAMKAAARETSEGSCKGEMRGSNTSTDTEVERSNVFSRLELTRRFGWDVLKDE